MQQDHLPVQWLKTKTMKKNGEKATKEQWEDRLDTGRKRRTKAGKTSWEERYLSCFNQTDSADRQRTTPNASIDEKDNTRSDQKVQALVGNDPEQWLL